MHSLRIETSPPFTFTAPTSRPALPQANKSIKYLNLSVNQLSDEDSQNVLEGVEANTTLKEFTAYNNGALDKATRKKLRGFKK